MQTGNGDTTFYSKIRNSSQSLGKLRTGNVPSWRWESNSHLNTRNIQKRREHQISNTIVCVCVVSQPQQFEAMPSPHPLPPSLASDRLATGSHICFSSAGTEANEGAGHSSPPQAWSKVFLSLYRNKAHCVLSSHSELYPFTTPALHCTLQRAGRIDTLLLTYKKLRAQFSSDSFVDGISGQNPVANHPHVNYNEIWVLWTNSLI